MKIANIMGPQGAKGFDARLLSGKILYPDVQFEKGMNGIAVYNNTVPNTITHTRIPAIAGTPKVTGYLIEIKHTSANSSPSFGGFYFANISRANATFVCKFKAKIPLGRTINFASNAFGDGSTVEFITPQIGTDKWEDYVCVTKCGATGTFSSTNFFYIGGGIDPTPQAPLIWYLSDATVYDVDAIVPAAFSGIQFKKAIIDATTSTVYDPNISYVEIGNGYDASKYLTQSMDFRNGKTQFFSAFPDIVEGTGEVAAFLNAQPMLGTTINFHIDTGRFYYQSATGAMPLPFRVKFAMTV